MFWKRLGLNGKRCSFCHRGEDTAGELIGAPSNDSTASTDPCYICGECVTVCNGILEDRAEVKIRKIMNSRRVPAVNRSFR
jgi:ATP-dependent protease Clp ATPase subunit